MNYPEIYLFGRYSRVNQQDEGSAAIEGAVGLCNVLTKDRSNAFIRDLASSLNKFSLSLQDVQRLPKNALRAIRDVVHLQRRLAHNWPRESNPELARRPYNIFANLASLRFHEDALQVSQGD